MADMCGRAGALRRYAPDVWGGFLCLAQTLILKRWKDFTVFGHMLAEMCRKCPWLHEERLEAPLPCPSGSQGADSWAAGRELCPDTPRRDFDPQGYLVMYGDNLTWERPGLPLTTCSAQPLQSAAGGSRGVGKGRVLRSPALGYCYFQRLFSASSVTQGLLHPAER